ncbi:MAG: hypothetical protein NTW87_26845, partial [Planctomycetota bacterium]|nr:hypothetical protein [Planctomycetota bacterium]
MAGGRQVLELFVERQTRTVRGNQILIALRLLLATVSLAVLLIEEVHAVAVRPLSGPPPVPLYFRPAGLVAVIVCILTILYLLIARSLKVGDHKTDTAASGSPSAVSSLRPAAQLALIQVFVDIFL